MAGFCCGVSIGETETAARVEPISKSGRRRKRMEIHHQFQFLPTGHEAENGCKRKLARIDAVVPVSLPKATRECAYADQNRVEEKIIQSATDIGTDTKSVDISTSTSRSINREAGSAVSEPAKFGMTSVCGRRRDMEDAVAIDPSFVSEEDPRFPGGIHFFGVYDGHGCSHVSRWCKDRMHEIVKSELGKADKSWESMMVQSFSKMDKDVGEISSSGVSGSICRCELRTPQCEAVGSTAVVALVTRDKIIVSNCGDSRAVLCRNGVAVPLSVDHKPDRPDELSRIQEAGGRVIFWDGARVFGVLAMSRAIGDNYLKPYVISEPEVTVTERTNDDECLILASDGLWDVVSNETACGVARRCLQSCKPPSPPLSPGNDVTVTASGQSSDKACSDASILLTKLALARRSADNVSVVVVDLRRGRH